LHALMALAMVAMVWPWGTSLAAAPQIVFFSLAAAWFAVAALLRPGAGSRSRALRGAVPYVLTMAAMAWMLGAMDAAMAGHGGAAGAMADMPGMDMSGSATTAMTLVDGGQRWTSGLLAAVFLVLAVWWLARGFDHARGAAPTGHAHATAGHGAWDLGCHGVMALGMAVMFVLLI
jgi:hypothetical protein